MGSEVRLRLWQEGEYTLVSDGQDGSQSQLDHYGSGVVRYVEVDDEGWRKTVFAMAREDGLIETALLADNPPHTGWFDPITRQELGDGFFGNWKPIKIEKALPDGGHITIQRGRDATGHFWESGQRTEGRSGHAITGAREWTTSWHPAHDAQHPGGTGGRTSTTMGRVHEPQGYGTGYSSFTTVRTEVPLSGGGKHVVTRHSEYNITTGDRTESAAVKQPDGSHYKAWRTDHKDGTWSQDEVSTDKHGNGTRHHTEGRGNTTTKDETKPVTKNSSDSGGGEDEDPPPDDDGSAPVGDGESGHEGNPDGPWGDFDRVSLARLLGPSWEDREDLDTLGDFYGSIAPWLGRIVAAARAWGADGRGGELLDTLGQPPPIDTYLLTGVEYDEFADHDSLGRPPPIFGGMLEADLATVGERTSAVTVSELAAIAEGFTGLAAAATPSLDVLRNTA
jgi:hypothetical protein